MTLSIRNMYSTYGVKNYYEDNAKNYFNPHEETIQLLLEEIEIEGSVLDLSCGTGSASLALTHCNVVGCDPYLYHEYEVRTENPCLRFSFDDIISGALQGMKFDYIICSFALHLCEESKLTILLYQLSRVSNELIIVTPHKRPHINDVFWKSTYVNKLNKVTIKRFSKKLE